MNVVVLNVFIQIIWMMKMNRYYTNQFLINTLITKLEHHQRNILNCAECSVDKDKFKHLRIVILDGFAECIRSVRSLEYM